MEIMKIVKFVESHQKYGKSWNLINRENRGNPWKIVENHESAAIAKNLPKFYQKWSVPHSVNYYETS